MFPELTERLSKLFRPGHAVKAASTIELDRGLTSEELDLTRWLLLHGDQNSVAFVSQLNGLRIHGKCSCGCPTVDFKVADGIEPVHSERRILADLLGTVDGHLVGILLHQTSGYLSCLGTC